MAQMRTVLKNQKRTVKVALTAYGVWRRIPKRHRKVIVKSARKHGPRLAREALRVRKRRRQLRK